MEKLVFWFKVALWRIGDGKHMKIWGDKWIPIDYAPKVLSPKVLSDRCCCVADLVDHDVMNWNVNSLNHMRFI